MFLRHICILTNMFLIQLVLRQPAGEGVLAWFFQGAELDAYATLAIRPGDFAGAVDFSGRKSQAEFHRGAWFVGVLAPHAHASRAEISGHGYPGLRVFEDNRQAELVAHVALVLFLHDRGSALQTFMDGLEQ